MPPDSTAAGLVAVAHALERRASSGCDLQLERVGLLQRLTQRAAADDVDGRARADPAAPKISPNSTMNMIGNANVKKNAGRSRTNMRTLASITA